MPASDSAAPLLVDTSVAVALTVADHEHHQPTFRALRELTLGLAGHAAFETFSVLTRLPPPARKTPAAVARLLAPNFPHSRVLGARAAAAPPPRVGEPGVARGGGLQAPPRVAGNE